MSIRIANAVKWRVLPNLQKYVSSKERVHLSNIGLDRNGKAAPKVLLLYATNSMAYFIQGRTQEGYRANHHFMFSLGLNMLEILVEQGYVVDCIDRSDFAIEIDHTPYQLILDEGSALGYLPVVKDQTRVFFASGLHWERMNRNMLQRTQWFNQAYQLKVPPTRFQHPCFSDVDADYLMYMGRADQMEDMWADAKRWPIGMPVYQEESWTGNDTATDFLWIGSWGALYKGLDIVTDAFAASSMPKLHVFGFLQREPQFLKWFLEKIKGYPNIVYHGTANFLDPQTQALFQKCRAHVYPSAWENGCATVAQTCHFGLIPILTDSANNPANHLGLTVSGKSREALVADVREKVKMVAALSSGEIRERGQAIEAFADRHFTRQAFARDFEMLVREIKVLH